MKDKKIIYSVPYFSENLFSKKFIIQQYKKKLTIGVKKILYNVLVFFKIIIIQIKFY